MINLGKNDLSLAQNKMIFNFFFSHTEFFECQVCRRKQFNSLCIIILSLLVAVQCLAAGSIIMNREIESIAMRPLAKDLTRSLEEVRNITRDQALRDLNLYTDRMKDALRHFDSLFAEFELR